LLCGPVVDESKGRRHIWSTAREESETLDAVGIRVEFSVKHPVLKVKESKKKLEIMVRDKYFFLNNSTILSYLF
jgi:hypothetical protein